ncbi:MAG: PstS family phosphate ABC transporter substrate-binding protein [Actinomycetota bacterium]|nr:PstS family phosphate ABC transporter substrate-binding protein [Actinomycetota bacterium]
MSSKWWLVLAASGVLALGVAACGDDDDDDSGGSGDTPSGLSGTIRVDGSSTVAPLTQAIAEGFNEENPDVDVTVGTSGTGGGFEKFCAGETDISDASRAIEEDEVAACQAGGIAYEEIQVANDALTVVTNPENPVTCLTVEQLKSVWEPKSAINSWSNIEGLDPPFDAELALYGPGTDSGTFDYFTEAINGEEGASRTDYNDVGEDDNATVTGVSGAEGGMGYFGYSFFVENEGTVNAVEIDSGGGCVAPSVETAQDGTYTPLSRALFVYPSAAALENEAVDGFLQYYLDNINDVAEQVGFIPLTEEQLSASQQKLEGLIGGGGGGTDTSGGTETAG